MLIKVVLIIMCINSSDLHVIKWKRKHNNENYDTSKYQRDLLDKLKYNLTDENKLLKIDDIKTYKKGDTFSEESFGVSVYEKIDKNIVSNFKTAKRKQRVRRETNGSKVHKFINIGVDILAKFLKPYLGTRGKVLTELARPLLVHMGTSVFTNGFEILKNIITKGTFLDPDIFRVQPYAAYPVFIPGYGSYILLSDSGTFDLPNATSGSDEPDENYTEDIETPLDKVDIDSNTTKKYENLTENLIDTDDKDKKVESKTVSTGEAFFLGHTHLIPIMSKPKVFESTKEIEGADWSAETDDTIRESVKQIVGTGTTITSFKKRILINVLKQFERAILES